MCETCRQYPCHPRCPNYIPPKATYYCSICREGILDGEDYIENNDGKYVHYDCLTSMSYNAMIKWLGGEIRTMEDD